MKWALILIVLVSISFVSADLCNEMYNFILSNDYNYSSEQLEGLAVLNGVSLEEIKEYRYNYSYLCDGELPKQKFPTLIIYKNSTSCDEKVHSLLSPSINFFTTSIDDCNTIKKLKYFFNVENYHVVGIRVMPLVLLIFIIFLIIFYTKNKNLNFFMKHAKI